MGTLILDDVSDPREGPCDPPLTPHQAFLVFPTGCLEWLHMVEELAAEDVGVWQAFGQGCRLALKPHFDDV